MLSVLVVILLYLFMTTSSVRILVLLYVKMLPMVFVVFFMVGLILNRCFRNFLRIMSFILLVSLILRLGGFFQFLSLFVWLLRPTVVRRFNFLANSFGSSDHFLIGGPYAFKSQSFFCSNSYG